MSEITKDSTPTTPKPKREKAERVKTLPSLTRYLKGRTLEDVSSKIGTSKSTLSLFFRGLRVSSAELVYHLSRELGVSMEELTRALLLEKAKTRAKANGKNQVKAVQRALEQLQRGRAGRVA